MKNQLRRLIREAIAHEMNELLKVDAAKIGKLKLALKKNYKNKPDLLKRMLEFITIESVANPYITYNKLVDDLMDFYKEEMNQANTINI